MFEPKKDRDVKNISLSSPIPWCRIEIMVAYKEDTRTLGIKIVIQMLKCRVQYRLDHKHKMMTHKNDRQRMWERSCTYVIIEKPPLYALELSSDFPAK